MLAVGSCRCDGVASCWGQETQMRRGALPAAPFQQIALIGGRTPLQLDLCSGNRDNCYRSSFYWHLKSMNY